jgi:cobalt/nickel transport protein
MKHPARSVLILALFALPATRACAHYNMLLPASATAKKGEAVAFLYQWGHPFEHQLFEAPAPQSLIVLAPDGKSMDLGKTLEKVMLASTEGKKIGGFRFRFTPEQRGDYVFVLTTPPIWMAEEEEFFQDTVKVVLHVQAQKGWDAAGDGFELVPLTRPYGLQAGMVFQAQARRGGKPVAGALVEVERYNPTPPRELPPDEQITRSARTDPNGVVTATLAEPGWWCLTAQQDGGMREHDGKSYAVRLRSTHWVWVDNKGKGE